jgi:hypothetical protein
MSSDATITVVEPGTKAMRHYRLMEPLDRLALGDCWIELQTGNALSVSPVHNSWIGTLVQECPKGVYLRPVATRNK